MDQFGCVPASVYNEKCLNFRQFQKRSFQSIKLNKLPRTKIVRLQKKQRKIGLQSRLLGRHNFVFSSYEGFKFADFNIGSCMNWNFLLDFVQQLRRKKADIPDIYFPLLDTTGISPTLIWNQKAKCKQRESWVPLKI